MKVLLMLALVFMMGGAAEVHATETCVVQSDRVMICYVYNSAGTLVYTYTVILPPPPVPPVQHFSSVETPTDEIALQRPCFVCKTVDGKLVCTKQQGKCDKPKPPVEQIFESILV